MTFGKTSDSSMVFSQLGPQDFLDLSTIHLQYPSSTQKVFTSASWPFSRRAFSQLLGHLLPYRGNSKDKDLTPTLENTICFLWLQLIHPGLPQLVKQTYCTELRNKSLDALTPEISQALSSLLGELRPIEDSKAMRIGDTFRPLRARTPTNIFRIIKS